MVLNSVPTADVLITFSSSHTSEGTASPIELTFTPANALTPQTVTITGIDDGLVDGDIAYTVATKQATSTDPNYNKLDPPDVSVTNTDNDVPGVTVNPTSGLTTTEAGGTAQFTVKLDSLPTADVTIALSSSDTTEGTVSPIALTFTPANWDVLQPVTVTGANDDIDDGNVAYSIVTAPAVSTDSSYNSLNASDVSVTNTDDADAAGITVTPTSGPTTTEAGGTATFTVVFTSVPTADVTIALSSSDASEGTVTPASLTFTVANALTPQTVTVTGVNDDIDDGNVAYSIVTAPAVSTDSSYNSLNASDVAVANVDNDDPPVTTLTIVKSGSGTVTGTGIACGVDCSETYALGAQVTLTASPAAGWTFGGWNGPCTGVGQCQVTMNMTKSVTALFVASVGVSVGPAPGLLPNGDRILAATLTARLGCGPIVRVQFGTIGIAFQNARISVTAPVGGPTGQTFGFIYTPPALTTSVTITIERVTPTGDATVNPIILKDGCPDEWRTFVGGGPGAFR